MAVVYPIRKIEDCKKLKEYFLDKEQYRNHLLYILGINSLLRISDMLKLKLKNAYSFQSKKVRDYLEIRESKNKKAKLIKLNRETKQAIQLYLVTLDDKDIYEDRYLFTSVRKNVKNKAITRQQAYRILNDAANYLEIVINIGNHTLRKTKIYHYLKRGPGSKIITRVGVIELIIVMSVLNHNDILSTLRYAGLLQDEMDAFHEWSIFK